MLIQEIETEEINIPRDLVRIGILTKDAIFTKGSTVANLVLNGEEIDKLPYQVWTTSEKNIRGILFGVNEDKLAVDLLNNIKNEYPIMNITPDLINKQKECNNIAIAQSYNIESLLKYLNFPEEITFYELIKIRKILSNKRKIEKLAIPCGYGKINVRLTNFLDYRQQLKFNGKYYKFVANNDYDNEKCIFDKSVQKENKQEIYPASIFELLVKNQKLGYGVKSKLECNKYQKILTK